MNERKIINFLFYTGTISMCIYVCLKLRRFLNLLVHFDTVYLIFVLLSAYLLFMRLPVKNYLVGRSRISTWFAGISSFIFLYAFILISIFDIAGLCIRFFLRTPPLSDHQFMITGFLCIILILMITAYSIYKVQKPHIIHYDLHNPSVPAGYRMVLLSDLHIGYYVGPSFISKVVTAVNNLNPDIVVISGDMINASNTNECSQLNKVCSLLSRIKTREGVYAVTGNHDPDISDRDFQTFLQHSCIHLLDDSIYTNKFFHLVGRSTRTKMRKSMDCLLNEQVLTKPLIILDHDPLGIADAVACNSSLVLCGHTHKGQIFPLNLFVRLLYSRNELWGHSKNNDTDIIVSAGTGYFSMPMRLGSNCEIISINFK